MAQISNNTIAIAPVVPSSSNVPVISPSSNSGSSPDDDQNDIKTQSQVVQTQTTQQAAIAIDDDDDDQEEELDVDPDQLNISDDLALQYRWCLWYAKPKSKDKEKKWDTERLKKVVEFGNVKEFWRVFNNLAPPSTLKEGSDLHLFRAGVQPFWEDSFNAKGGTWTYRISKDDINQKLDTSWFNTVLTMIGDQFDDADDICGIVVSVRNSTNRIGLWVKHADDKDAVRRIGKQFKDINRIRSRIYFYSHEDAKTYNKPNKSSEMML